MRGDGPFTVFAPTEDAFAALPAGTIGDLLKPENKDQLVSVLTHHASSGKNKAKDVTDKVSEAATVQSSTVTIDGTDGVKVDGATVATADVKASNGVIHVIDAVILP